MTTPGGPVNQATETVRFAAESKFPKDIAIVASVNGVEQARKFVTATSVSKSFDCAYIVDQRRISLTLTCIPKDSGLANNLKAYAIPFAINRNINSETNLFADTPIPLTDANGKTTIEWQSPGVDMYLYAAISPARPGFTSPVVGSTTVESPAVYIDIVVDDAHDPKSGPNLSLGRAPPTVRAAQEVQTRTPGTESIFRTGEKKLFLTDLIIKGRGIDYEFIRTYRGFNYRKAFDREDFGENWVYNYGAECIEKDGPGEVNQANYINFRDGFTGYLFVNIAPGRWAPPLQEFVALRINPFTNNFEIRDQSGMVRIYHHVNDPNVGGRLREIRDRNDNFMSFLYDQIDPDNNNQTPNSKFVLTQVIDTMGQEIRYQYYAPGPTADLGRPYPDGNSIR